jgi:hypothetical protein
MAGPGWVWLFFFCLEKGRFCRGFLKKRGAEHGFLLVRTWFLGGETWGILRLFSLRKNMPLFHNIIGELVLTLLVLAAASRMRAIGYSDDRTSGLPQ